MHDNRVIETMIGERADLTIVLAHGRGESPADMQAHAMRLGLDNVRFVFPCADGQRWYPQKFMAPIADNEPDLSAALACYENVVTGILAQGVPVERIVVGGFSQGACLTAEYLARHPRRYGAAIIWTGGLIGPRGTMWPLRYALRDMPAYISTADNDPWVPAERAQETYDWLIQSGAAPALKIFAERDHGILDVEIEAARNMLEGVARHQLA